MWVSLSFWAAHIKDPASVPSADFILPLHPLFKADLPVQTCFRIFDGVHPSKHPSVHSTAGSIFSWTSSLFFSLSESIPLQSRLSWLPGETTTGKYCILMFKICMGAGWSVVWVSPFSSHFSFLINFWFVLHSTRTSQPEPSFTKPRPCCSTLSKKIKEWAQKTNKQLKKQTSTIKNLQQSTYDAI